MGTVTGRQGGGRAPYSHLIGLSLIAVLAAVAFVAARPVTSGAQITLVPDPARTRGAADAPVTIVEFSDYQ